MHRSLSILTILALAAPVALAGDASAYHKSKEIPLPGKGGFDYVSVDAETHHALVAHGTTIDVVDIDAGKVLGSVAGVEGAHGACIVADVKRGFATAGKKKALIVFDPSTLKVEKEVPTGEGPDALLYVSSAKEVWTMNHRAGTVTCVDATTLEAKATIQVGGALESGAEYAAKGRVFVNVEDKSELVEIDVKKHEVVARRPLAPAEEPTGLAIDEKAGVLFVGCGSGHMAVVDAASGKVIATPEIGKRCDAAAFDPATGLAFASCGDGTTTIVRSADGKYEVAAKIDTAPGGKTCALDRATHRLIIAAGTRGKDDVRLLVFSPADEKAAAVPAGGEKTAGAGDGAAAPTGSVVR